ncbi:MAG: energy transducer TonB [Bacteroidales bacterium]|nr:energy transducer TonB [Bacteroidales bacterium]
MKRIVFFVFAAMLPVLSQGQATTTIKDLMQKARQGDTLACYQLGKAYLDMKVYEQAIGWLTRYEEMQSADECYQDTSSLCKKELACMELAGCYLERMKEFNKGNDSIYFGIEENPEAGYAKDRKKLIGWLTEAGKLGNAEAIRSLKALGVDVEEALLDEKAEFPQDVSNIHPGESRDPEYLFLRHIAMNLRYPQPAREQGIQGEVIVSFVVEADGTITNVQVEKGIGGGCDEEAVRVIKSMPKWKPAVKNGVAIPFKKSAPINFRLQ